MALTYTSLLSVGVVLQFNVVVDRCHSLLSNSLPSFETLRILFLEHGLTSWHGFSFLFGSLILWDIGLHFFL